MECHPEWLRLLLRPVSSHSSDLWQTFKLFQMLIVNASGLLLELNQSSMDHFTELHRAPKGGKMDIQTEFGQIAFQPPGRLIAHIFLQKIWNFFKTMILNLGIIFT